MAGMEFENSYYIVPLKAHMIQIIFYWMCHHLEKLKMFALETFQPVMVPEYSWKIARWTLNTNQSIM
jgi:hypothetical protein